LPQDHDVVSGGRKAVTGHPSKGPTAADTSMATKSSLSACAGHRPSGRRSFRKQWTVNPPTAPAHYNFLYHVLKAGQRTASGRPRPATLNR
jgi:hypothetical protein